MTMDNHLSDQISKVSSDFVPPRHWVGPEELEASYWNDSKVLEKRGQEFHDKPIETIALIDKMDTKGIARRDFLTIMGASMAMASFSCARRPVHKIIPYVVKPEEVTPGVANYYASTIQDGHRASLGVLVKTREGRPIKLEGNPDHPLSGGALSQRAQAAVLDLYDVDRLKAPVSRSRGGSSKEISWADADGAIMAKLKGASKVRVLSGEIQSESTQRLIKDFLGGFSNGVHVQYEPLAMDEIAQAQEASYGASLIPNYHFDRADVIVSLGADFLGTWLSPVEHMGDWSKNRKLDSSKVKSSKLSKVFVFEPTMTITGASADDRYAIRPGDELKVAMAIAYELIINQKVTRFASDAAVNGALASYRPETVAAEIGLPGGVETFKKVARALWASRGKSLVVGGSIQSRTKDAVALQVAINLLNSALENDGSTVDGTVQFRESKGSFAAFAKLVEEMKAGAVEVLVVYRSNPMFTAPRTILGLEDAMKKVPLIIAVADREDETAKLADFVLPDHHPLESWGDSSPYRGLYSLQQPTIQPIHSSRAFEDCLLTWIKGAGLKASALATQSADWHAYLRGQWMDLMRQAKGAGNFEQFWETTLRDGVFVASKGGNASARSFRTASLASLPKYSPAPTGLILALYESVAMGDGRQANNAWIQEMPDPISSITWDNYLNVSPQTAKKLGIAEHDVVEVKSGDVAVQLPVHVQPGMHDSVVSVAVGYGRRAVGKVGNQTGVDVFPMVRIVAGAPVFSGHSVTVAKTGRFYQLAATQRHTLSENRPIINDITMAQFLENPEAEQHTNPELRMEKVPSIWPKHEYKGYRWGMTIDLNSCTGCGSCVIACQAENNTPVVGRDQVRVSRQMHWIRIDRYYSGTAENPEMLFQPMLCQHCENAPCETVCPVLATVHDDEGLNVQVYNRCVGTRYCQNNCPYKVRRFNFFDHWKSYEGTLNMAWNPDVTVRSRGIMEKCTFCVQRIANVKGMAKDDGGRRIMDGELKTACQQTCPTSAISFGDINAPDTKVSKLRSDARAFRVLETLNTAPVISYLTKVRNNEKPAASGHSPEKSHGHGTNTQQPSGHA